MEEGISIASVTVAYNGAKFLPPHLEALKRQSRKLDEIVVVNNASTDETSNLLRDQYPDVTILNLAENGGVGGGYAAGLGYAALQRKHEWVWLFDQDSVPADDGLEKLLKGLQDTGEARASVGIIAPLCVNPATRVYYPGLSWRGANLCATPLTPGQKLIYADSVLSSGSLVRRQAIEAAGLPRTDFFMDFVDHEHCLRLRRHGFKVVVVQDTFLEHTLGEPEERTFFGLSKHWTDHPPWREYYMTRNEVFTMRQHYPAWKFKAFTFYRLGRHAFDLMLFGKARRDCLAMMWRGYLDGRASRLGIRVLPKKDDAARSLPRSVDSDRLATKES